MVDISNNVTVVRSKTSVRFPMSADMTTICSSAIFHKYTETI